MKWLIDIPMATAMCCYAVAAIGYTLDGKPWFALTMMFYSLSIGTIYMAGGG